MICLELRYGFRGLSQWHLRACRNPELEGHNSPSQCKNLVFLSQRLPQHLSEQLLAGVTLPWQGILFHRSLVECHYRKVLLGLMSLKLPTGSTLEIYSSFYLLDHYILEREREGNFSPPVGYFLSYTTHDKVLSLWGCVLTSNVVFVHSR